MPLVIRLLGRGGFEVVIEPKAEAAEFTNVIHLLNTVRKINVLINARVVRHKLRNNSFYVAASLVTGLRYAVIWHEHRCVSGKRKPASLAEGRSHD